MILFLLSMLAAPQAHAASARSLTSWVVPSSFNCQDGGAGTPYRKKPDFAALEADPATRAPDAALRAVMPGDFADKKKAFDQECVDRIYAQLPSGPIPAGVDFEAFAFAPDGGGIKTLLEQVLPSSGEKGKLAKAVEGNIATLPNALIQGMVFSQLQGGEHPQYEAKSRLDRAAVALLSPSAVFRSPLYFPSHVYCGQSLLDSRRESIVIDPTYPEDFPDFKAGIDDIPGHKGMNLREEIRMVRPGFYLGRVYGARVYLMSFILYNAKIDQAKPSKKADLAHPERNECWLGTQPR
jgi:hypothetical protein